MPVLQRKGNAVCILLPEVKGHHTYLKEDYYWCVSIYKINPAYTLIGN